MYQAVVDDLLRDADEAEGIDRRGRVLAGLLRLKQVCNHPAHYLGDGSPLGGRSGKLTRVEELLDEILAEGDRVLCFTQFAEWGHLLQPYLARRFGTEPLWLHGGVSRKKRDDMVERFQGPKATGPPILLVSLKAGGTGLNLTAASHVIHLDRWWNPAVEDQATDRAYRIGQRRTVLVHKLVTRRHGGGADRRDDRPQAGAGRAGRRHGRGLAHLAVDRRASRPRRARRRRGGGRLMAGRGSSGSWRGAEARGPWFEPSVPRPVEGGLATSKQRGAMAATWWSQRFVQVLESYGLGARMQRGRRYARQGQVISLDVDAGLVTARVQGSRATPYRVEIAWPALGSAVWTSVASAFAARAGFAARLLAGEVPPDLEAVFESAGVPLFPRRWSDLRAHCSCPDWENPCKHLAAVLYVFADRLDDDPWLLLAWRGRDREAVLGGLRVQRRPAARPRDDRLPAWWPFQAGAPSPAADEQRGLGPGRPGHGGTRSFRLGAPPARSADGHGPWHARDRPARSGLRGVRCIGRPSRGAHGDGGHDLVGGHASSNRFVSLFGVT